MTSFKLTSLGLFSLPVAAIILLGLGGIAGYKFAKAPGEPITSNAVRVVTPTALPTASPSAILTPVRGFINGAATTTVTGYFVRPTAVVR